LKKSPYSWYRIFMDQQEPRKRTCPARKWTKRFGIVAFLFFLIKGLAWLIVPGLIAYFTLS